MCALRSPRNSPAFFLAHQAFTDPAVPHLVVQELYDTARKDKKGRVKMATPLGTVKVGVANPPTRSVRPVPTGEASGRSTRCAAGCCFLLAISAGWSGVSRHASGRAVAAVLHTQNGLSLRVVALYGPVGACLPDFGVRRSILLDEELNMPSRSFPTPA